MRGQDVAEAGARQSEGARVAMGPTVATGLRLGRVGVDDYESQFRDPAVRDLMARTAVFEDPEAAMLKPGTLSSVMRAASGFIAGVSPCTSTGGARPC